MKPQTQIQNINLEEIAGALANNPLDIARSMLANRIGEQMTLSGVILKVVKRSEKLHLQTALSTGKTMEIFADFSEIEWQKVKAQKVRKSSTVHLIGKFESFGTMAVALGDCRLQVR